MNCIFTTTSTSESTYPLLKAAINSLQKNTTLTPIVIICNNDRIPYLDQFRGVTKLIEWLENKKVQIIYHIPIWLQSIKDFTFNDIDINKQLKNMYTHYPNYYNSNFILAETLRIDIPILFPNEKYVLYADCDVLFLKEFEFIPFEESIAAATRQGGFFNNGVMIFNIKHMLESYQEFKDFYMMSNYTFDIGNTTSQGAYNTFYQGEVHSLQLEYNWHVVWGINKNAYILHYVGPKIQQWKDIWEDNTAFESLYCDCVSNRENCIYYINKWNQYCEPHDQVVI